MRREQKKQIIFSAIMVLIAVFFWWTLRNFFTDSSVSVTHLLYLIIFFTVFLSCFFLFSLLVESKNFVIPTLFLCSFSFFLFFSSNYVYGLGAIIFFLFLFLAHQIMTRERRDRISLPLRRIWVRGLPLAVVALALAISLVYYFNPLLKITQEKIEIPSQWIGFFLRPLEGMISRSLPFYSSEMTVDELLSGQLIMEGGSINEQMLSPQLLEKIDNLDLSQQLEGQMDFSPSNMDALFQQPEIRELLQEELTRQGAANSAALAGQREEFAQSLGIELRGDEKMAEVVSKIINARLSQFIGPYAKEISIGIAVALFFFLRLIGIFVGWLAMSIGGLIFWLLKVGKVVRVAQQTKQAWVIEL